jgi:hypothetical protein
MTNPIRSGVLQGSWQGAIGVLAAVALATSACSDSEMAARTQPTTFSTSAQANVSFSTVSDTVSAVPVFGSSCPGIAPFRVPIVVLVSPNGAAGLAVTQIQLQFTDTSGIQMPQVTLPAPVPTTQFGDALDRSRDPLQFPLSLGIGCGAGRFGTVVVIVDARDGDGRHHSGRMRVNVR